VPPTAASTVIAQRTVPEVEVAVLYALENKPDGPVAVFPPLEMTMVLKVESHVSEIPTTVFSQRRATATTKPRIAGKSN
jgi:hypothetical protein